MHTPTGGSIEPAPPAAKAGPRINRFRRHGFGVFDPECTCDLCKAKRGAAQRQEARDKLREAVFRRREARLARQSHEAPRSVLHGVLPRAGEYVLAWDNDFETWCVALFNGDDHVPQNYVWDCDTYGLALSDVDFWLPLPPDPRPTA